MRDHRAGNLLEEVKKNPDVIHQLEMLANSNPPDSIAINTLGVCYEHGYGVNQDPVKAFILYRHAAGLGSDVAMYNLGLCYQAGRGTPMNLSQAAYWYFESAKQKTTDPNGSPRAIRQLEELARMTPPNAAVLNNLGICYEHGYGVAQDPAKAFRLYRHAADLGSDVAMHNLGVCYQAGRVIPMDLTRAAYWYLESAKQKTANLNGSPRAIKELKKLVAGDTPHKEAIIALALCYENGYSVTQDADKASALFTKAGMPNLSQNNICKKLACHLRKKGRNPHIIKKFESEGHCLGFAFLALYARWLQSQPVDLGKEHHFTSRDDYRWLSDVLTRVHHWDGVSSLNEEDENQFERLASLIIAHQGWHELPIKQGDFHDYAADSRERKITREYSIASRFTQYELAERLPFIVREGKLVLLLSHYHCVGFIKIGELFYFIDSENPRGLISVANVDELSQLIFSANFLTPSIPSPLALSIFGVRGGELEEKHDITELKYPSQESLLEGLCVFDSSYISPASTTYAAGFTDLHRACWIGCTSSIEFILDKNKGDLNYLNKKSTTGWTALMMSVLNGQREAAEQLLNAGADKDLVGPDQNSAITLAAKRGFIDVVKLLLSKKAYINFLDQDGVTLLFDLAIRHNDTCMVKDLVLHLLDIYEKNLDKRKEEYKPRFFSFLPLGYSKSTKKAAVAEIRDSLRWDRPIKHDYIAVLNNGNLKMVTAGLRKYQPIKLKLGL